MYRLDKDLFVFQSCMWQTNSVVYLNEAAVVVVDPTYFPSEIQIVANRARRSRGFKRYLIFTHSDFDHIVGHQNFKGFQLVGHQAFSYVDREAQIQQLAELDETYYIRRDKKFVFPELDIAVEDEECLPLANDRLIIRHAPGHTGDGLFIISEAKGILISGDYLSDLEFPFIYFSFDAYLKTLKLARQLVEQYDINTVISGHGDFATTQKDIYYRIDSDIEYLLEITNRAADYCTRGLSEKEIMEVLKDMSFRGKKITGALVKLHLENIKKVVAEISGDRTGGDNSV